MARVDSEGNSFALARRLSGKKIACPAKVLGKRYNLC
jgi:hypothetical protein